MDNTQILTIVLAVSTSFVAVLTGVLLNNARLGDIRDLVNRRVDDIKNVVLANVETRASAKDVHELRTLVEKNHSEMLLKFAEMDNRLSRIEGERRIVQ